MLKQLYPEIEKRTIEATIFIFLVLIGSASVASQTGINGSSTEGNLLAEYRLDNGVGDMAYDTANNNDGTINGAKWTEGKEGDSLLFDSSTEDYVQSSTTVSIPQKYSMFIWIKGDLNDQLSENIYPFGFNNKVELTASSSSNARGGILIRNQANDAYHSVWDGTNVLDGQWHHWGATVNRDDGSAKVYLDGEKIHEETIPDHYSGSRKINIGSWSDTYGHFKGKIDEARLYSEALNNSEVKSIYNTGSWRVGSNTQKNDSSRVLDLDFQHVQNGQVLDTSGYSNHGTINGASQIGAVECQVGRCFNFDGSDDNIDLGNKFGFEGTPDHTIAFWAKPKPSGGSYPRVISKEGSSRAGWNILRSSSGDSLNYERRASDGSWNGGYSINYDPNEWSHFVYAFENDTGYFYRNGIRVGSSSFGDIGSSTANLYIGGRNGGGGWDSPLDEFQIYNRTLSQKEVWKLYTKGRERSSRGIIGASNNWRMSAPDYGVVDSIGGNDGNLKTNLLDNSGFESGSDSTGNMNRIRTNYAGYSEVTVEDAKNGQYSGKHVKTGEDDQWSAVSWDLTSLESGKSYDFGTWYRCSGSATDANMRLEINNGTGWSVAESIPLSYTCDSTWRFVSGESEQLPSNMQSTNIVRFKWGYSTNSGTMYVDDMYLREDDADWSESSMKSMTLDFDGAGDHIQLDRSAVMEKEGSTLVWSMNPDDTTSTGLFTDDPTNVNNHIEARTNQIFAETQTNCNHFEFDQYEKKQGWNSYAIVFENSKAFLYENGKLLGESTNYGSTSCSGSSTDQLVDDMSFQYIGSKTGYSSAYDGEIGKVQLYPYALDRQQMKQVMNNGGVSIRG